MEIFFRKGKEMEMRLIEEIDHLGPDCVARVLVEGANAEAHSCAELVERDKLSDGHRAGALL
jgi:hypothetical protein